MLPQNGLLENFNSYESISDEEELQEITYDIDCSKNLQSLYSHHKKVQSTTESLVESLTGDCHQPTFANYEDFRQRNPSILPKDILPSTSEIRNQILQTGHGKLASSYTGEELLDDSGHESISDEENDARLRFPFTYATDRIQRGFCSSLEVENQQQACEWPAILEEANDLAGLQKKTYISLKHSVVPEERRFHKGARGSSRFRFSFRSLSNREDISRACASSKDETYNSFEEDIELPGEQDYFEHRADEDTVPQILGNILEENAELDNIPLFHKQLVGAASVSELLEDMHKSNPSSINLDEDNTKGKEKQKSSSKRTLLYLGDRVLENKDTPEFIGEISSEDEYIDQDHQIAQIVKGQTMADMFQEAFNTATEDASEIPRSIKLGFGYHERLQKVMQLEKDGYMAHLKHLQTEQTTSNESNSIAVRILSRTFEAKLTVCQCLFGEYNKSLGYEKISQKNHEKAYFEGFEDGKTMKRTIIFSPIFCNHVELEVGNIVCIHPPWKEVQVNGGEIMILCTYFSPMKAQNLR